MKQILTLFSLLILPASSVAVQESGSILNESLWQRYTVKGDDFSVKLPLAPAMGTTSMFFERDDKEYRERHLGVYADGHGVAYEPGPQSTTPVFREKVYTGREVDKKARLIMKIEPQYTEEARQRGITGTVVLKVIFSANGSVVNIVTASGLPSGLTERAIDAARKIKFIPAMKDGKYVSMWMQLEYNFNLY